VNHIRYDGAHILLLDIMWFFLAYLCGVKQESDCLCYVGARSGADSEWKF